MKKVLFLTIIVGLIFTANAFGQSGKRTAKPKHTNIFLDGGNDSWNTRQKPKRKKSIGKTVKKSNNDKSNSRKRPNKPVRNLEQTNGGMTTADETPEFGERNAQPKDLTKNQTEAKPALLEFQIPEKVVTKTNKPEIQNQRTIKNPQPRQNSLDGKGTDVNVEEIELYKSTKPKPKAKRTVTKRKTS